MPGLQPIDAVGLLSVMFFAAGAYALWRYNPGPGFTVWRAVNFLLVMAAVFQLRIGHFQERGRLTLAVAIDVSDSMKMTGRLRAAQKFVKDWKDALEKDFHVRYYLFSSSARETGASGALSAAGGGQATDISGSLYGIKSLAGEDLAGMLLLSDGNHNAGGRFGGWAESLGVPLFTIELPEDGKIVDASVASVKVGDFAFKNTPFSITASLEAAGCAGKRLKVRLLSAEPPFAELASGLFVPGSAKDSADVELSFTPNASGIFRYVLEVEPAPGETVIANNRKRFSLEVIRDRIRVLFLCGQPGPEYAFLRQTLKNDPLVELVSFVILRNPENLPLVSDEDLALIPFPVQSIFTKDIYNFDILILENFTYRRLGFNPEYLANIRDWVLKKGGGIIMTGGRNSFSGGGWQESPLGDVLPVTEENVPGGYEEGLFRVAAENYEHPMTALYQDPARNAAAWRELPEADGCNALKPKDGATVLARHRQGGWALITAWDRGAGRAAAVGTNTTWRWALQSPLADFYSLFWKNAVRYVSKEAGGSKLQILFDRPEYYEGQGYSVKVRVSESVPRSSVDMRVTGPGGKTEAVPLRNLNDRTWEVNGRFDSPGKYVFSASAGLHRRVRLKQSASAEVLGLKVFEEALLDNNGAFLKKASEDSKGLYFSRESFAPEKLVSGPGRAGSAGKGRRKAPLGPSSTAVLAAASLILEILFRKMRGKA